jgi:PAS domain S-box-containing protein
LILILVVRRGFVNQAAVTLIAGAWIGMTYQAWSADGVRDVAIYFYILIIFIAVLLANWQISIAVTVLSIAAIWVFAITEAMGLRAMQVDLPLSFARDLTAMFIVLFVLIYLVINTIRNSLTTVREVEQKFHRIFHVSPVATAIISLETGRLLDANPAYWQLTDLDRDSAIGRTTIELGHWRDSAERQRFVTILKERKSLHNPSYTFKSASGQDRTTLAFHELIDFEREPAILAMFYDITDQKNAENALRGSEARTRALLDAIPDMIFEFQRDGTILQFLSSSTNRPLLPPEQFLGKTIGEVLPVSVAQQTMFAIERALDSGQVHAFEYQLLQESEHKTFEARITPLSSNRVLAIVREVTLQKWILGEREALIAELELKNTELERFTYTVSHDLKSPLITIKGFLGFLRDDAERGNMKRLESDIERIGNAADKMQQLLNDLLELSRVGRLVNQSGPLDLNKLISEVLELLHGRLSNGMVPVRVSVDEGLPRVYGDRARLLEVWQNLIDNAAKFMGDQPNPHIEIGQAGKAEDDSPVFFVRDNGMGIDPKFNDRIFGLFHKLDPLSEGTGIGLALVKRIIELHGGRIWVESQPGQGTSVYFTLRERETHG